MSLPSSEADILKKAVLDKKYGTGESGKKNSRRNLAFFLAFVGIGVAVMSAPFLWKKVIPSGTTAKNRPAAELSAVEIIDSIYPDVKKIPASSCSGIFPSAVLPVSGVIIGCAKGGNPDAMRKTAFIMRYLDGRITAADLLLDAMVKDGDAEAARDKARTNRPTGKIEADRLTMQNELESASMAVSCLSAPENPLCGSYPIPKDSDDDLSYATELRPKHPMAAHFVAERAAFSGFDEANSILCDDALHGVGTLIDYDVAVKKCSSVPDPKGIDRDNLEEAKALQAKVNELTAKGKDRKEIMLQAHYKFRQMSSGACAVLSQEPACSDEDGIPIPKAKGKYPVEPWPFDNSKSDKEFILPLTR